ncbi:MAG TPA: DUF4389 domain-containing protein [Acidimicrobiales bacterium]
MTDTQGGQSGAARPTDYPATFTFDPPDHVANWRPLVNWLLAIPHLLVVQALQGVSQILALISWVAILFTGRLPAGVADFQAMYMRYYLRTMAFAGFLREEYPPFAFATTTTDPGDDARVRVNVVPQIEDRNRLTAFFRIILAIPHLLLLVLFTVALLVVALIGLFAVLFTGHWPAGLQAYAVGVGRWWLRVETYMLLLTDEYPPFAFDELGGGAAAQPVTPPPAPA